MSSDNRTPSPVATAELATTVACWPQTSAQIGVPPPDANAHSSTKAIAQMISVSSPFASIGDQPLWKSHAKWADIESDSDEDRQDLPVPQRPSSPWAKPLTTPPPPHHTANPLPTSLLIQSVNYSFSANLSSPSTPTGPSSNESPSPLDISSSHNTTVGFALNSVPEVTPPAVDNLSLYNCISAPPTSCSSWNSANNRVSVPIEASQLHPGSSHRHGYAGLLSSSRSASSSPFQGRPAGAAAQPSAPRLEPLQAEEEDARVNSMVLAAVGGFAAQQRPEAATDGMGGTYFLRGPSGEKVGIFKPCDEEPLAPNNPKQWQGRAMGAPGMKPSVRVGEAALREVAAYLLDHEGFAGVPPACLVNCYHPVLNYKVLMPRIESLMSMAALPPVSFERTNSGGGLALALARAVDSAPENSLTAPQLGDLKLGSLQAFAQHKCDASDMAPSHFSADNVHRVGVLDIRLLNCDRHLGNLLVRVSERGRGTSADVYGHGPRHVLVPIDHGYALPEALDNPYFEWLFWPQTNVPFGDDVKRYVAALDARADIAMLRERVPALREECLRCLEVTTKVLQLCVAGGLTLFEIGSMFTRPEGLDDALPSDFEAMCMDARDEATGEGSGFALPAASDVTCPSAPGSPISGGFLMRIGSNSSVLPCVKEADVAESVSDSSVELFSENDDSQAFMHGAQLSPESSPRVSACGKSYPTQSLPIEGASHVYVPPPCIPVASPQTPLYASLRYSYSGHQPNSSYIFSRADAYRTPCSTSGAVTSRMHNTWVRGTRSRRTAWRVKHGGTPAAYPPLLLGSHPDQVNYVFTDITDAQWATFMDRVDEFVTEELARGTWKAISPGRMAGSCPITFNDRMR